MYTTCITKVRKLFFIFLWFLWENPLCTLWLTFKTTLTTKYAKYPHKGKEGFYIPLFPTVVNIFTKLPANL